MVVCGSLIKMSQYVNIYLINNPNSAFGSKAGKDYPLLPNEQFKWQVIILFGIYTVKSRRRGSYGIHKGIKGKHFRLVE